MTNITTSPRPSVEELSDAFSIVIREFLTENQLASVNYMNDPILPTCATHDFCDANMAMLEAWTRLTGESKIDAQNDADCKLINAAWKFSRDEEFQNGNDERYVCIWCDERIDEEELQEYDCEHVHDDCLGEFATEVANDKAHNRELESIWNE